MERNDGVPSISSFFSAQKKYDFQCATSFYYLYRASQILVFFYFNQKGVDVRNE